MQQGWRQRFSEGKDTPLESSVALVLQLVSGQADALSGRFISVEDDINALLQGVDEIKQRDLYTLRLRQLNEH